MTQLEYTIANQAAQVQLLGTVAQQPAAAPAPPPGSSAAAVTPGTAQHAAAVTLESTIQQEYAVFASIAKSPTQASALVAAASTQSADVRDAVTYDVQAVQEAAAQQAAIAGAAQTAPQGALTSPGGGVPVLGAPLNGPITQGFGPSALVFEPSMRVGNVTYPHFHTGLDIAAPRDPRSARRQPARWRWRGRRPTAMATWWASATTWSSPTPAAWPPCTATSTRSW